MKYTNKNVYHSNIFKYILLIMIFILISFDQIIKFLVKRLLSKYETLPIIDSVLHLTYVKNYGAAFGFLQNQKNFLILITSLILIGVIVFMFLKKIHNNMLLWGLTLVISGGVGNLIDRIADGYVVDYIDFRLINFAVFNLADSYIVVGVVVMAIYILFVEPKEEKIKNQENQEKIMGFSVDER